MGLIARCSSCSNYLFTFYYSQCVNTEVLLTSELKPERLNKENIARILIRYVYVKNIFSPSQTDTNFGRNRAVNATVWMYIKGIGIAAVLCPLKLCIGGSWDRGGGSFGVWSSLGPISFIFMQFSAKILPNKKAFQ